MTSPAAGDRSDTGLACLVALARVHELAVDAGRLRHEFGRAGAAFDAEDIVRAARWLGLKARLIRSRWQRLPRTPLPAIAELGGGFVLLAGVGDEEVLVQRAFEPRAEAQPRARFESAWSGRLVLVTRRAHAHPGAGRFGFAWFLPHVLEHRVYLGEVLVASFVLQLFALVTPVFFQVMVDKVLVHRGLTTLDILVLGLALVSVFDVVLGGLKNYVFAHTTNRIDVALGAGLYRHLLRLPVAYFGARRVGDTVARVRELETLRRFITGASITVLVDVVFTLVFFAVMALYSPALTLVAAATLPCYALLALAVTPPLRARLNETFNRGADSHAYLVESVSGIETIKAAAVEPAAARRWEERLAAYVGASFRTTQLANLASQTAALINKLMVVAILWLGAHRVMDGAMSVGQLVAFNMLAARISAPVLKLVQLWQDFQQARVSVERLGDILNAPAEPAQRPGRGSLPRLAGHVRFDEVRFRYRPDGPEVLAGVSFEVRPGEVIGIVGRSGSGKSTLARLLQRLYVPERGRVLVDGVDLALVDTAWLRRNTGVVLQENVLFNRSVRENIALADPALPLERIVRAATLAGAHDFILELPLGYDTEIGEHGADLSGGQRQRLAIARALVTDPRLLIFDEATSALDYESEALVQANMRDICRGRTVLIVAHRLSAVSIANRIVVLDRGRVVESGAPAELAARTGYFAGLLARQRQAAQAFNR